MHEIDHGRGRTSASIRLSRQKSEHVPTRLCRQVALWRVLRRLRGPRIWARASTDAHRLSMLSGGAWTQWICLLGDNSGAAEWCRALGLPHTGRGAHLSYGGLGMRVHKGSPDFYLMPAYEVMPYSNPTQCTPVLESRGFQQTFKLSSSANENFVLHACLIQPRIRPATSRIAVVPNAGRGGGPVAIDLRSHTRLTPSPQFLGYCVQRPSLQIPLSDQVPWTSLIRNMMALLSISVTIA